PATPDEVFPLYANREAANNAGYGRKLQMVSYFQGSVAGLEVGADVTLHGLKVGEVTDLGLVFDPIKQRILVPVHYVVEGDRVAGVAGQRTDVAPGFVAAEMVRRGFRATLDTTSLITGGKVVSLRYVGDAPPAELGHEGDVFVVPSSETGGLDAITRSAAELLTKMNSIDFASIGKSIAGTAKGLDDIVNGEQLRKTMASLQGAVADAQDFMRKLDTDSGPALARLPQIAKSLDDSLVQINRLAASLS